MNKEQVLNAVKKMPREAFGIRIGKLWRQDIGEFYYISFLVPKEIHVNEFQWDRGHPASDKPGATNWLRRLPIEKGDTHA